MVTKITNESIVAALPEAARINSRIAELRSEIKDRRSELEKLDRMSEELERVSCVRNGVAVSVSEHYVSAVCWEIHRRTMVYEMANAPGVWKIRASFNGRDRVLPTSFSSKEDAIDAACDWVSSNEKL